MADENPISKEYPLYISLNHRYTNDEVAGMEIESCYSEKSPSGEYWYALLLTPHGKVRVRHREGGPAVSVKNVSIYYYKGLLHRTDGPAVKAALKYEEYLVYGLHHRTDGPAIIGTNGRVKYALNGFKCDNKEEFLHLLNSTNIKGD